MSRSEDRETQALGASRIAALENEAEQAGKSDEFRRARAAVEEEISRMSEESRSALIEEYSGKSVEEADAQVRGGSFHANIAEAAEATAATKSLLGDDAGDAYISGGIDGLREVSGKVENRRIRRMLEDRSVSNEDIQAAIVEESGGEVGAGDGPTATTPGLSEEERNALGTTDEMLAALTEGMGEFPGAVNTLNTASQRLLRVAERLEGTSNVSSIYNIAEEGAGALFDGLVTAVTSLLP
jgi:hypothetical protein